MQHADFLRYGGDPQRSKVLMRYWQIAFKLRMLTSTLYYAFKRYEANGYRFVPRDYSGLRNYWQEHIKIKGAVKQYLLSHKCLQEWAGYTIAHRCKLIKKKFDLDVSVKVLTYFYQKHGVKYLVVNWGYQQEGQRRNPALITKFTKDLA